VYRKTGSKEICKQGVQCACGVCCVGRRIVSVSFLRCDREGEEDQILRTARSQAQTYGLPVILVSNRL
jgi:hypothetical protein